MEPLQRPLIRHIPPLFYVIGNNRIPGAHKPLKILRPHNLWLGLYGDCSKIHGKAGIWDCTCLEADVSGIAGDITCFSGDCSHVEGSLDGKYGSLTGLRGDISQLKGDLTLLKGDATGLTGDCTGIAGDLDQIPLEWRGWIKPITHWVAGDGVPPLEKPQPGESSAVPSQSDLPLFAALTKESPAA